MRRRQVPQITGWATEATPEALFGLFRDSQRTHTQFSATALRSLRQQMDVGFCSEQEPTADRQTLHGNRSSIKPGTRSPEREQTTRVFC